MPIAGRFSFIGVNLYTKYIFLSTFLSLFLGASSLFFHASGTNDVVHTTSVNNAKHIEYSAHQLFYNPLPPPIGIQLLAEPFGFTDVDEEEFDNESEEPDNQLVLWLPCSVVIHLPVGYSAPCPSSCSRKTAPEVPLFILHNSWKIYQA